MAIVTATGGNILSTILPLFDAVDDAAITRVQTSTTLIIDTPVSGRFTFTGTGVKYNAFGEPVAGTLTGLSWSGGSEVLFSGTGYTVDVAQLYAKLSLDGGWEKILFAGNDEYHGSDGADRLIDRYGHNLFLGGDGSDTIQGGSGNDHIYGQSPMGGPDGGDSLSGGDGSDYIQGNAGDDTIDGGDGSDRINGGSGNDLITDGNPQTNNDRAGNDTINGNLGNDTISGGNGNDLLRGGQGNDVLRGDNGNDVLMGDRGADTLTGGDGKDIFVFGPGTSEIGSSLAEIDHITDFNRGTGADWISLGFKPAAALLGPTATNATNISIADARIMAQALMDNHPGDGEVAAIQVNTANTLVFWASNGGGMIDSVISVDGQFYQDAFI